VILVVACGGGSVCVDNQSLMASFHHVSVWLVCVGGWGGGLQMAGYALTRSQRCNEVQVGKRQVEEVGLEATSCWDASGPLMGCARLAEHIVLTVRTVSCGA
jgi:hypothetical protein